MAYEDITSGNVKQLLNVPPPIIQDRRAPLPTVISKDCGKLDTFANLTDTLKRLEDKMDDMTRTLHERIDKISDGMNNMVRLEQQLLEQSKDIVSLEKLIEALREKKIELERKVLLLQNSFDAHKANVGKYERVGWMVVTGVGSIAGAFLMKKMGL